MEELELECVGKGLDRSPSPESSARMTIKQYLQMTMMVNVQKIRLATPKISTTLLMPLGNVLEKVYNGLVPISPKTTPIAENAKISVARGPVFCGQVVDLQFCQCCPSDITI